MKNILTSALCACLLFLSACGDKKDDSQQALTQPSAGVAESNTVAVQTRDQTPADYQVEHKASLVRSLPKKALAYFRIPHLAGYLTSPQADAINPALSHSSVLAQSQAILKGIDKNLISSLDDAVLEPLLRLLLDKQQSPVEVAVMAGIAGLMTPEVLVKVKLGIADKEELVSLLNDIVANGQGLIQIAKQPNDDGEFRLVASDMSVFGYFDFANNDFTVLGGPTATESTLKSHRNGNLENHDELYKFEQGFDSAGAGFAVWADLSQIWGLIAPMAPPEIVSAAQAFQVQDTEFVYLGSGSTSGVGSARLHLEYQAGKANPFAFLPSKSTVAAKTSGLVEYAATLPMISAENLDQVLLIDRQFNKTPALEETLAEAREKAKLEFDVDFDQLVATFGSSMTIVKDASGTWASLEIKDSTAFKQLIELSVKELGAKFEMKNVNGIDIAHYSFPSLNKLVLDQSDDASELGPQALMQIFAGSNTHLYMVKEGSNMIIASLPQVLLSRDRHLSNRTVNDWLKKQQASNDNSVLSFTAEVEDLPKKAYYMYLAGIQSLSDIAGVEPNLEQLPLAEDLALAETGRVGAALETGPRSMSLVMNYSQSPADFFFGGDTMTMVAVAGILAAVAVPAYQDYTVRAQVSAALMSASQLKSGLAEFSLTNGRFPNERESSEFSISTETSEIWFDPRDSQILIEFGPQVTALDGEVIMLTLTPGDSGVVEWPCSYQGDKEHLIPATCRR